MSRYTSNIKLLLAGGVTVLAALGINMAFAEGYPDRAHVELSQLPKTIIINNLDTATLDRGDPLLAATAQAACSDCHSTDYIMTQPKLNCAVWGKEIVKMGNVFDGMIPWTLDGVTKAEMYEVLAYLTDNYGSGGSAACTGQELDALPLN